MCDYSLTAIESRPAVVGDKLEVHNFGTGTHGFMPVDSDRLVAVCVLPGTEIAFDKCIEVGPHAINGMSYEWCAECAKEHRTARFRQINKDIPHTHHDALELPDGEIIILSHLTPGQYATVLQLPAMPRNEAEVQEQRRVEFVG